MGRQSFSKANHLKGSVNFGKHNHCKIFPSNVNMVAEAIEQTTSKNWVVRANTANDLIINVEDCCFYLHKLPMVSRSGYLNRMVSQRSSEGKDTALTIQLDNLPGGSEIFELIIRFCYGWTVDLKAENVASLYCAAHHLEMSDDLEPGNLIFRAECFLSFEIFSSWKDTFQILKSCESVYPAAEELQIVKRCTEAIAWKACMDTKAFNCSEGDAPSLKLESMAENWWFEDASLLRIDHFIEVIESVKRKGMRSELVGSCLAHWTAKWLSRITSGTDNLTTKHLARRLQRVTIECLIKVLPLERSSVPCNFLLHLLKVGLVMEVDSELLDKLSERVASMVEQSSVADLLVKNIEADDSLYDVGIVTRVVQCYSCSISNNQTPKLSAVAKLVDGYLTLVARDVNLTAKSFQSLVEALPKDARNCNDNLYRAIDMYLKAHPSLDKDKRMGICKALEYHKLSREAREHVMKNERLPLNITERYMLIEQVNMKRSMTDSWSNYRRANAQTSIRISKDLQQGSLNSLREIRMMRREVEMMKMQLDRLHTCRIELQRQAKKYTV